MDDLETLFGAGALGQLSDGQLLERFLEGREVAFEALVTRHGPMVMRLCRGILDDPHDAQDAFQATFLVLVRRAGSIWNRDSLSSWLFGTAMRVAARARADAARRRRHERRGAAMTGETICDGPRDSDDLTPIVREEVTRLPEKYRAAVVLCDLMGCGYEEAARVLDCPLGTLKARLSRARARLRERLTRRGLASLAVVPPSKLVTPAASVPAALARSTARAAATHGTSRAAALAVGTISDRVVFLTERIVSSMFLAKPKLIAALTLVLGVSATGVALFLLVAPGPEATKPAPPTARPWAPPDPGRPVLTPGDADRHALAVARSLPDPAERAQELLDLGQAEARRSDATAAKTTLRLAVEAAVSIPPNGRYVFPGLPHPIIRIAAAQAELGDDEAVPRPFLAAAQRIAAEDDGNQLQQWNHLVQYEFRVSGRVSPETVAGYRRCLEREPSYPPQYLVPILLKLQAASGDPKGALRAVREGEEFVGPEGAHLRKGALLGILGGVKRGDPVAEEVLEELKKAVVDQPAPARGRDSRPEELLALAKEEVRLGRFADAVGSAGSMRMTDVQDKFDQAQTFVEIARAQARAGDPAGAVASAREAIALCDSIPDEGYYKTFPLYRAGAALVEAGALAEARKLAETFNPSYRSMLRIQIAEASRAAGDDATALEDLKEALRASEEDRASAAKRRIGIYSASLELARLQARLGDLPAALRTVATITDAKLRDGAVMSLARARAREGDLASARDLVARIDSPEARGKAWIRIACDLPEPKASKRGPSTPPGP